LAELIREYTRTKSNPNGCELSIDVLSKLAGELAEFDSGHALMARLVGEELARNNCDIGKIEELISKAKGKAEAFIILHINGLFKVHEDPDTAKALVEIFALRRPFVNKVRPGDPILAPGIVELIGEGRGVKTLYGVEGGELRGWLAIRQHDLIEEAIGKLLDCVGDRDEGCEVLSDVLKPWKSKGVMESLRKVSEKVWDVSSTLEYFVDNYGKKLTNALKVFSNKCWRRAALIIGFALAGYPIVHRLDYLPKDIAESLGDSLRRCGVDDYLLVGDEIPPLIRYLIPTYVRVVTEAFVDKYNETVAEVRRVLGIARGRGGIYVAEAFYGLGLASIIANAAESDRPIKPSDANAALRIASSAIQHVVFPILVMPILRALRPLRDKAPQGYLELLDPASSMENLDLIMIEYILNELNDALDYRSDVVKEHTSSLVHAIIVYTNLLRRHPGYFNDEIKSMADRVADLLNELSRFRTSLGIIAWAFALAPALDSEDARGHMEKALSVDVASKASEVLEELNKMRERVQELINDEGFMSYVESRHVKADEKTVKRIILDASLNLKHALALYKLDNNELREATRLFNEAAGEYKEIGDYENYLVDRSWALRVKTIEGSLFGGKLVDEFRQLYEETFNEERFKYTAPYLSIASGILGDYLVSLALINNVEEICKLPEEYWWVLNTDKKFSVLTRLTLNALLNSKSELNSELGSKLVVKPRELIESFGYEMYSEFLLALMVAFGVIKLEDGVELCGEFIGEGCIDSVLAVKGNSTAIERLRERLIDDFHERISEGRMLDLLKGLGANVDKLFNEFRGLVNGPDSNELDGRSLVQLLAHGTSRARLALMLYALINGDERLAKAHALYGAVDFSGKLFTRLFLETYRACCDLGSEEFRLAIARLFYYHV
ncbi:MAG: hypothetical protein RQ842_10580, partial [Vulcanisaeta sp.]|nr:hypothetical protein [Vulcanisaeta sp.]